MKLIITQKNFYFSQPFIAHFYFMIRVLYIFHCYARKLTPKFQHKKTSSNFNKITILRSIFAFFTLGVFLLT